MKRTFFILLLILTTLSFSACKNTKNSSAITEENSEITVVTSFYPLEFFTKEIVEDKINVINLSAQKEVHDYTPSPQEMLKIYDSDLLIVQGSDLEPWLDDIREDLKNQQVDLLEVSSKVSLHEYDDTDLDHDDDRDESHGEDEHEEEAGEHHEEEGHDKHEHGDFDPHTWLDPVLAQDMVDVITDKVSSLDVKNKDFYLKKAADLKSTLTTYDSAYSKLKCQKSDALISHDAFSYLEKRYGFNFHPIAGLSIHDEPSAKLLSSLKKTAEDKNITHLLTEENSLKEYSETLSRETGLEMLPVHSLETNLQNFLDGYMDNFNSIKTALECQ